jgi:iron(III) transport system ATP-binding protein
VRIEVDRLTKRFGDVVAVDDLSLTIEDGELVVLLGPSGCGKTTTMRAVVGLEEPTSGRIAVGDTIVFDGGRAINVPPNRRKMGMVFQSYAIWPHKTVFENVSYPLERQRVARREIEERVRATLELVGLSDFASRGASMLSGGQMQRVALARSVVSQPRVLLLDEPLSNLDAKLRDRLRFELREIQQQLGITTIYVTHDQTEALALADRIAVMRDGKIVQLDTPPAIYREPTDAFVADFLGVGNILAGEVVASDANGGSEVKLERTDVTLTSSTPVEIGASVKVCIRPEHLAIAPRETDSDHVPKGAMPAEVLVATFLGNHVRYLLSCGGLELQVVSTDTSTIYTPGTALTASVQPRNAQLLRS